MLRNQSSKKLNNFLSKSKWLGKLDENVASNGLKSKVERHKTIAYKSLYRRLPSPVPSSWSSAHLFPSGSCGYDSLYQARFSKGDCQQ